MNIGITLCESWTLGQVWSTKKASKYSEKFRLAVPAQESLSTVTEPSFTQESLFHPEAMISLGDSVCALWKKNSSQECVGRMACSYCWTTKYFHCSISTSIFPLKASKIGFTDA